MCTTYITKPRTHVMPPAGPVPSVANAPDVRRTWRRVIERAKSGTPKVRTRALSKLKSIPFSAYHEDMLRIAHEELDPAVKLTGDRLPMASGDRRHHTPPSNVPGTARFEVRQIMLDGQPRTFAQLAEILPFTEQQVSVAIHQGTGYERVGMVGRAGLYQLTGGEA